MVVVAQFQPRILKALRMVAQDPQTFASVRKVKQMRLSYLEDSALFDLSKAVRAVESSGVKGSMIEMGTALGGSAIIMAKAKGPARSLLLYDVFGMIPPPTEKDGEDSHDRYDEISSGHSQGLEGDTYYGYQPDLLNVVKDNFRRMGVEPDNGTIHFVEGLYEDVLEVSEPVALAHIDCDWYSSVITCLERITPHLVPGGRLVIDDYYHWSGCRRAIDEYFADTTSQFEFRHSSRLHIVRR